GSWWTGVDAGPRPRGYLTLPVSRRAGVVKEQRRLADQVVRELPCAAEELVDGKHFGAETKRKVLIASWGGRLLDLVEARAIVPEDLAANLGAERRRSELG